MQTMLSRREFHLALLAPALGKPSSWTLGFSTYGMPKLPLDRALREIALIGYDSVEIAILPDREAAPEKLTQSRRKEIRKRIVDQGLKLTALMENLAPSPKARTHAASLDRCKRAADLAQDLAPEAPPLVETVLGGGTWDKVRGLFRDRLGDWIRVLAAHKIVLAIKPHRSGAMSLPAQAVGLIQQLRQPAWLKLAYDQSHYELRGLDMDAVVRSARGHIGFVAVKDVVLQEGKAVFLLPGESGKLDYAKLFTLLSKQGYHGEVNCEVSGMISSRTGYDPIAAARRSYRHMAQALARAGLRKAGGADSGFTSA